MLKIRREYRPQDLEALGLPLNKYIGLRLKDLI